MTREEFDFELTAQIKRGNELLGEFESLKEVNDSSYGMFGAVSLIKQYDKPTSSRLKKVLYIWEKDIQTFVQIYWGNSHPDWVKEFSVSDSSMWIDCKDNGTKAVSDDLTVLESYKSRLKYLQDE